MLSECFKFFSARSYALNGGLAPMFSWYLFIPGKEDVSSDTGSHKMHHEAEFYKPFESFTHKSPIIVERASLQQHPLRNHPRAPPD